MERGPHTRPSPSLSRTHGLPFNSLDPHDTLSLCLLWSPIYKVPPSESFPPPFSLTTVSSLLFPSPLFFFPPKITDQTCSPIHLNPFTSSPCFPIPVMPLPLLLLLLLSPPCPLAAAQVDNTGPTGPYYNSFTPSSAIIIVILVAALFLIGVFSIYIHHCNQSPNTSVPPLAARSRRQPGGLDPTVIDTFPTLDYSAVKIHKIGKGALECAVCLNEFEDSETLRLIPKCDHVFHPDCIDGWLASHTTCPVCRANLVPQPGDSLPGAPVLDSHTDLEAQNDAREPADVDREAAEPDVMCLNQTLNRNRTQGSRSSQTRRFPRSHSTGHSLLQPGENTDRFTLRLPADVRNQLLNQKFHRARSLVILPRESSSRRGYRTGGEGSSRGRFSRRLDRGFKSDRWVFTMAPPFLVRASSVRSTKVASDSAAGEETSADHIMPPSTVDSARPPV